MTSSAPKTPQSCIRFQPLIDQMIDGELESSRTVGLQEHLRSCPNCRRVRKDILRLRGLATSRPTPELEIDFVSQVKDTLFAGSTPQLTPQLPRTRRKREPKFANLAVYAAMLMIGCFFAFGAYRFGRMHESQDTNSVRHSLGSNSGGQNKVVAGIRDAVKKAAPEGPQVANPKHVAMMDVDSELPKEPVAKKTDSLPGTVGAGKTPLLDAAMAKTRKEDDLAAEPKRYDEDDDLFDSGIPTEDVILSSQARRVFESCDIMEAVKKKVSAKMPTVEGGMLHASPLILKLTESTLDLERLLKKGLITPGSRFVVPEDMNIVFEIQGEGVHFRIEVDRLKDKAPRINIVDVSKSGEKTKSGTKRSAVRKLKLR